MANFGHLLAPVAGVAQLGKVVAGHGPPGFQGVVVGAEGLIEFGGSASRVVLMAGLASIASRQGEIAGPFGLKENGRLDTELGEIVLLGLHFGFGNAADQVGLHILRFRFGRVVHVAADVEVVVVGLDDLGLVDQAAVLGYLPLVGEDEVDLLDVFGAQLVLVLAFGVFPVGVDEQHLVAQGRRACSC